MKRVEVGGMTLEFDEKLVMKQEVRVGDNVNLIVKEYSDYKIYKGVVISLLPYADDNVAIEVLYIDDSYTGFEIKKKTLMSKVTDEEVKARIIKIENDDFLPFTKERAIDILDKSILDAENKYNEAKAKKEYFLKYYNKYFEDTKNE